MRWICWCFGILSRLSLVKFLGAQSDIPELLSQTTIGVQSSHLEGFGLTAVEIMATGLLIIITCVPGLADVVGDAGFLFQREDHVELAGKINALLSDEKMYNEYVGRGLKRSEDFAIETTANRYLDEYMIAIISPPFLSLYYSIDIQRIEWLCLSVNAMEAQQA